VKELFSDFHVVSFCGNAMYALRRPLYAVKKEEVVAEFQS
jgi:hypothetical protein